MIRIAYSRGSHYFMQFTVPQYIEVQDKIVGPLTLKQFFYLGAAFGFSAIAFYVFNFFLWFVFTFFAVGTAASLAFIKIHGRPLSQVIMAAFKYFWEPRLYVWRREPTTEEISLPEQKRTIESIQSRVSAQQQLKSLAEKLLTTRLPIPHREKSLVVAGAEEEKYTVIRHITGEKELAKKIDYSEQ